MSEIQELAKQCGVTAQGLRKWCERNGVEKGKNGYHFTEYQRASALAYYESRRRKVTTESGKQETSSLLVSHLLEEVADLRKQLAKKDEQLAVKDEQISARDTQISDLTRSLQTALDATKALGTSTAISAAADSQGALLAKEQPVYEAPSKERAPLIKRLIDAFKG